MFRPSKFIGLFVSCWVFAAPLHAQTAPGVGRVATAAEIARWDIDVRPDFKGLPQGAGTVLKGQQVWDAKCASCHGVFGEATHMSAPIVGGTNDKDIALGRVASLTDPRTVLRSSIMKLATLSTLWDYINRAMPWDKPKTLSTEEVYAVTAYILHLADIVPEDFTLDARTIVEAQKRLPNRNGMTTAHGLWLRQGQPDVNNPACMRDCPVSADAPTIISIASRDSHGNLFEQNRNLGAVQGLKIKHPEGQ